MTTWGTIFPTRFFCIFNPSSYHLTQMGRCTIFCRRTLQCCIHRRPRWPYLTRAYSSNDSSCWQSSRGEGKPWGHRGCLVGHVYLSTAPDTASISCPDGPCPRPGHDIIINNRRSPTSMRNRDLPASPIRVYTIRHREHLLRYLCDRKIPGPSVRSHTAWIFLWFFVDIFVFRRTSLRRSVFWFGDVNRAKVIRDGSWYSGIWSITLDMFMIIDSTSDSKVEFINCSFAWPFAYSKLISPHVSLNPETFLQEISKISSYTRGVHNDVPETQHVLVLSFTGSSWRSLLIF